MYILPETELIKSKLTSSDKNTGTFVIEPLMPGYGMMGNWGFGFFNIIYFLLLIGITILVYVWIIKLLKSMGGKR